MENGQKFYSFRKERFPGLQVGQAFFDQVLAIVEERFNISRNNIAEIHIVGASVEIYYAVELEASPEEEEAAGVSDVTSDEFHITTDLESTMIDLDNLLKDITMEPDDKKEED